MVFVKNKALDKLSKEELCDLIERYAKNWLALDGVWFQSIEQKLGMEEAMYHDTEAWRRFTKIEAMRIKDFLKLPEQAGLDGLQQALSYRFYANLNQAEMIRSEHTLLYRTLNCRVQAARSRRGMEFHPCKPVGCIEYAGFAETIDSRITCQCVSCYPDVTDPGCSCAWLFTITEGTKTEKE